jgi:hypothetical protein
MPEPIKLPKLQAVTARTVHGVVTIDGSFEDGNRMPSVFSQLLNKPVGDSGPSPNKQTTKRTKRVESLTPDDEESQHAQTLPVVDDEEIQILCALFIREGLWLSQQIIESVSLVSRGTIYRRMPGLLSAGLVKRNGKRGGTTITQSGIDLLRRVDLPSSAKLILQRNARGRVLLSEIERAQRRQ